MQLIFNKGIVMSQMQYAQGLRITVVLALLAAPAQAQQWRPTGVVGLGLTHGPDRPGSDQSSATPIPLVQLVWQDRYFLNQHGIGFYALRNRSGGKLSAGLALGYDFDERSTADDPRLAGLQDVEAGALLTGFLDYDLGFADLGLEISRGISSGGHEGTRATVSLEFSQPAGERISLSIKPYLTWADATYSQAFYGVSSDAAARSGFARHDAQSGIERAGIELEVSYRLSDRSGVFLGVSHAELMGDAKDSPITFASEQTEVSTGIFFRF